MADLNLVILVGRLTRDPALRYTSGGQPVTDMSLATGRTYMSKTGERKEEVCYVDIVVWGKQAEAASEYLKKGSSVLIEGRLQLDTWETKEGEKRSRMRVQASRVQFLDRAPKDNKDSQVVAAGSGSANLEALEPSMAQETEDDIPF